MTMLNQTTVIYIILSAMLLYLYYKRGGIGIFAAFAVVVAGTLFLKTGSNVIDGFSIDGKGGNMCAKMGFTETKIDKKSPIGSLKKINDNFKKTLLTYATFDNNEFQLKEETQKLLKGIAVNPEAKSKMEKEQKENKDLFSYMVVVTVLFMNTYTKSDSGEMTFSVFNQVQPVQKTLDGLKKEKDGTNELKKAFSSGEKLLKMVREIKELDVVKNADKKTKEAWDFVICAIKYTIDNIKKLDKTLSGDDVVDDDNHDDEEEKPKKNKKKATKKKKNEDDEDEE